MKYLETLLEQFEVRGSVAEIGYFQGIGSTPVFLNHIARHGGVFYTMDIFPDDRYYERALEQLHFENTHVLKGSSVEIGREWTGEKLDFIFIDGDHGFPRIDPDGMQSGVALDILAWHPFLKPGGVMAFHDYSGNSTAYGEHSLLAVEHAVDGYMVEPYYSFIGYDPATTIKAFRKEREGVLTFMHRRKQAPASSVQAWQHLDVHRQDMTDFLIYGTGSAAKHVMDCILAEWGSSARISFTQSSATEAGGAFGCPVLPLAEVSAFEGSIVIGSIYEKEIGEILKGLGKQSLDDYYGFYEFVGWCHVGRLGFD